MILDSFGIGPKDVRDNFEWMSWLPSLRQMARNRLEIELREERLTKNQ